MARDFKADSIKIANLDRALSEDVEGNLVFRDKCISTGVRLKDLTGSLVNIDSKMDKVPTAIVGNFGSFVAGGGLIDSGIGISTINSMQSQIAALSGSDSDDVSLSLLAAISGNLQNQITINTNNITTNTNSITTLNNQVTFIASISGDFARKSQQNTFTANNTFTENVVISGSLNTVGSVTISNAFTLPTFDGATSQVLITDGNGNVTWANADDISGGLTISGTSGTIPKFNSAGDNIEDSVIKEDSAGRIGVGTGSGLISGGVHIKDGSAGVWDHGNIATNLIVEGNNNEQTGITIASLNDSSAWIYFRHGTTTGDEAYIEQNYNGTGGFKFAYGSDFITFDSFAGSPRIAADTGTLYLDGSATSIESSTARVEIAGDFRVRTGTPSLGQLSGTSNWAWNNLILNGQIEQYKTYTNATNYERFVGGWDGTVYELKTEALGTGVLRNMQVDGGDFRVVSSLSVGPSANGYTLDTTDGASGQVLVTDGNGNATWSNGSAISGVGGVSADYSLDNAIPKFVGTDGNTLETSAILITDANVITISGGNLQLDANSDEVILTSTKGTTGIKFEAFRAMLTGAGGSLTEFIIENTTSSDMRIGVAGTTTYGNAAAGDLFIGGSSPADTTPLVFKADGSDNTLSLYADGSQSSNIFQILNNGGTELVEVASDGKVGINTGGVAPAGQLEIVSNAASVKTLIVQGATSQTANLQEWQDSSGSALVTIDDEGRLGIGAAPAAAHIAVLKEPTDTNGLVSIQGGGAGTTRDAYFRFLQSSTGTVKYAMGYDASGNTWNISANSVPSTTTGLSVNSNSSVIVGPSEDVSSTEKFIVNGTSDAIAGRIGANVGNTGWTGLLIGRTSGGTGSQAELYGKFGIFFQAKANPGRGDAYISMNNDSGSSNASISDAVMKFCQEGNIVISGGISFRDEVNYNGEFTFPQVDGSANQVLTTDGAGTVTWEDAAGISETTTSAVSGVQSTLDSVAISSVDKVIWEVVVSETATPTNRYSSTISAIHDGSTGAGYTEYGIIELGTPPDVTLDVDVSASLLRLLITTDADSDVTISRRDI